MRTTAIVTAGIALLALACRDGTAPRGPALEITTDSLVYHMPAADRMIATDVSFTNTSSATIWVGACAVVDSMSTPPHVAVYGTQSVSYDTTPATIGDVAMPCSGPVPYALAPGQAVGMRIISTRLGRLAYSAPFATSEGGAYDRRAQSGDFNIVAAP